MQGMFKAFHREALVSNGSYLTGCPFRMSYSTTVSALRPLLHAHCPVNLDDAGLIICKPQHIRLELLFTARFKFRHEPLPGAVVFHCDMRLDLPLIADLELIRQRRQALIDEQAILVRTGPDKPWQGIMTV
jgi:hypothetical protein